VSSAERLGRYRIGERIGEGGMGEVFRGEIEGAEGFSKPVAIKRIRATLAAEAPVREAFIAEARLARRLEHGNIVQIYDLGVEGALPYLVVEFIDGISLAELTTAERLAGRRVDIADALYVVEHVAAALDYAHRLTDESGRRTGVVHRDVNPRNILLSREGVVKLADFGIAKALRSPSRTLPGVIKGTLWYLSPEQATGQPIDARTDQFATGVVLYELLSGRNPFDATDDIHQYRALLDTGLPPLEAPGVDKELAAIVARASAAQPSKRYPTMAELRHELEAWRVARKIRTSPDGIRRRVRAILGEAMTGAAVSLDGVLADRLGDGSPRTRAHAPAAPARSLRAVWLGVAAVAAVSAIAAAVLLRGSDAAAPGGAVDAAPVDASPTDGRSAPPPNPPPDGGRDQGRGAAVVDAQPRRTGRVKVNVIPWADVAIAGRRLGRTPVDADVPEGRHRLVLHNPDLGKRASRTVVVRPGETLLVTEWPPSR
jgi:serine/threonine-protein kinase